MYNTMCNIQHNRIYNTIEYTTQYNIQHHTVYNTINYTAQYNIQYNDDLMMPLLQSSKVQTETKYM